MHVSVCFFKICHHQHVFNVIRRHHIRYLGRIRRWEPAMPSKLLTSKHSFPVYTDKSGCQCSNKDFIELEIPPDCGNGAWNAGIPLARLLFHVPAQALLSLLAGLLLERRIILVSQDRDLVSAAVHAATALLYPMRWQHIYLPLLPNALKVGQDDNLQ